MLTIFEILASILLLSALILALSPRDTVWTFDIGSFRIGLQHDLVPHSDGRKYLERWFIYLGITIRFHLFHSGDDDRAPHCHPWPFITFPLRSYREKVFTITNGGSSTRIDLQTVKRFRFHYRPATYRHIVLEPTDGKRTITLVVTGWKQRSWGFYPFDMWKNRRVFIPWRQWV